MSEAENKEVVFIFIFIFFAPFGGHLNIEKEIKSEANIQSVIPWKAFQVQNL